MIWRRRSDLQRAFVPRAATALAFLVMLGLLEDGFSPAGCSRRSHGSRTRHAWPHADRSPTGSAWKAAKDEFRELADAFDAMLEQLDAQVAEQQRFAANASHELRTPLAITQTLLDVARNDPTRDKGELVERLHAVNTRAIDLTEALLVLSRAEQQVLLTASASTCR